MRKPMRSGILLILLFVLSGCGYYFPHLYEGPRQQIYLADWSNRTDQLGLNMAIRRALVQWFQKSEALVVVKTKAEADLVISGEVAAIHLPSLARTLDHQTIESRVHLQLSHKIVDQRPGGQLNWARNLYSLQEAYLLGGDAGTDASSEQAALDLIVDEVAEKIYLGLLDRLRQP